MAEPSNLTVRRGAMARIKVETMSSYGPLTEFPLAERSKDGWQNGIAFYPDEAVTAVCGFFIPAPQPIDSLADLEALPAGSVVLDSDGDAWQRRWEDGNWRPAIKHDRSYTSAELFDLFGPLSILLMGAGS